MKSQVESKQIIVVVSVLALLGIGYGYYAMMKGGSSDGGSDDRDAIRRRMLSAGMAMRMYAIDNEGRFPLSETWMDRVGPYSAVVKEGESTISAKEIFQDPRNSGNDYGVAMNGSVSGMSGYSLANYDKFILLFTSTNKKRNAAGGSEILRCDIVPEGSKFKYGYGVSLQPVALPVNCMAPDGFTFDPVIQQ